MAKNFSVVSQKYNISMILFKGKAITILSIVMKKINLPCADGASPYVLAE